MSCRERTDSLLFSCYYILGPFLSRAQPYVRVRGLPQGAVSCCALTLRGDGLRRKAGPSPPCLRVGSQLPTPVASISAFNLLLGLTALTFVSYTHWRLLV